MITVQMIKALAPNSKDSVVNDVVKFFNIHAPKYDVDTYLRVTHFMSQAAHESASFRTLEEYATGAAYEGRKDLGNVSKGDGAKYKGRGIFQLTGRANYRDMGRKLGLRLEETPAHAATPEVSVLTALEYWKTRGLNAWADKDDVLTITKKINGGTNGLEDRKNYLAKAKKVFPKSFGDEPAARPSPNIIVADGPPPPINPIIPAIVVAKRGDTSDYVKDLQEMLIKKGATINADGDFGPATETAVKTFQTANKLKVTGIIDTDTLNKLMV